MRLITALYLFFMFILCMLNLFLFMTILSFFFASFLCLRTWFPR
jgi:hypothetical protein